MNTKNPFDAEKRKNPHGVNARKLYDKPEAMVTHITLEAGQRMKQHKTPVDVIFYVLEEKGIVEIGNEKQEVTKDTLIESPKDIMHCWYNESNSDLRFLVIKTPKPTKPSKFLE